MERWILIKSYKLLSHWFNFFSFSVELLLREGNFDYNTHAQIQTSISINPVLYNCLYPDNESGNFNYNENDEVLSNWSANICTLELIHNQFYKVPRFRQWLSQSWILMEKDEFLSN